MYTNTLAQTLRYAGFPEFIKVLVDTGFLDDAEQDYFKQPIPWKEATQKLLNAPSSSEADLIAAVSSKATFKDEEEKARLIDGLKWSMCLFPLSFTFNRAVSSFAIFRCRSFSMMQGKR